jgi:hypothetical protein
MNWQPIETAPKGDGDYILVFPALMGVPLVVTWCPVRHFWRMAMTEKKTPFKPTHWMPLPQKPSATDPRAP